MVCNCVLWNTKLKYFNFYFQVKSLCCWKNCVVRTASIITLQKQKEIFELAWCAQSCVFCMRRTDTFRLIFMCTNTDNGNSHAVLRSVHAIRNRYFEINKKVFCVAAFFIRSSVRGIVCKSDHTVARILEELYFASIISQWVKSIIDFNAVGVFIFYAVGISYLSFRAFSSRAIGESVKL